MSNKVKKGILKRIGFDTYKDIKGLDDIKVRIINSATGVLYPGSETVLSELSVDPTELAFKQAAITLAIVENAQSIKVDPVASAKFGIGDIVEIVYDGGNVFDTTKITSVDYSAGIINLESSAKLACALEMNPKIKLADATGTYTGEIQIPVDTGTYFIWVSSTKAGKSYNYGMIEVVDNDLSDVITELGLIKDFAKGNSSTAWGNIQI